jgi:hypothetical protein
MRDILFPGPYVFYEEHHINQDEDYQHTRPTEKQKSIALISPDDLSIEG